MINQHDNKSTQAHAIELRHYQAGQWWLATIAFLLMALMATATLPTSSHGADKANAPLVDAILTKDHERAMALLDTGAYIEQKNSNGMTPLMAAARRGDIQMVRLLLTRGANITDKNNDGQSPLACAVLAENATVARILLEAGAPVDPLDNDDSTPLMLAARMANMEIVQLLLDYGADHRKTNKTQQNLLMLAAKGGSMGIVEMFLDRRISANAQDLEGMTTLTHSLANPEIARLLISRGADLNAEVVLKRDDMVMTLPILVVAVLAGNGASAQTLLDMGAEINATGSYGLTPLLAACLSSNWELALQLLHRGADADPALHSIPEEPDMGGLTPLMLAAAAGHQELVELLLERGALVNRRNDAKMTPLMLAEQGGHPDVAKLLRDRGGYVTTEDLKEATVRRTRNMDARALSEAKNIKTCLEAYYADHQRYPDTIEEAFISQAEELALTYQPSGAAGNCQGYELTIHATEGNLEYRASSDTTRIMKRPRGERLEVWSE